ncbi:hypothetical protein BOTBODRAFT_27453 [Botryobasidium botryosum FD-172 SS1]|uniref:Uncharacterized protein n=1 Tax=Botryobasidium botryosum (strain FD-172 SS1) TaxID=930990 RepID=A0A067N7C1_BOTB1|nr:hypothetical protein BOTBODRAFT_27453 [Botryobasidium botryosum FD-172 SS1]
MSKSPPSPPPASSPDVAIPRLHSDDATIDATAGDDTSQLSGIERLAMIADLTVLTRGYNPLPPRIVGPDKVDERCFTYCSQTAQRRSLGEEPICRTYCWRKLFQYEKSLDSAARSKTESATDERAARENQWFEGKYIYVGKGRERAVDRMESMKVTGLKEDTHMPKLEPARDEHDFDLAPDETSSTQVHLGPLPSDLLASAQAHVDRVFGPSQRLASRYLRSFEPGGAQERFASAFWEKTREGAALDVGMRVGVRMWDIITGKGGEGGDSSDPSRPPLP